MYFNRITEPKRLSPFVAPEDQTYLTVEITFSKGDEIDQMIPDALIRVHRVFRMPALPFLESSMLVVILMLLSYLLFNYLW